METVGVYRTGDGASTRAERPLVPRHVPQPPELRPHAHERPHPREAAGQVQARARRVGLGHAADRQPDAAGLEASEKLPVQSAPDAPPATCLVDVDGDLAGAVVGGLGAEATALRVPRY